MPNFKVAHIREQGNDMIIVPLDRNFDNLSSTDQSAAIADIQIHANGAGLAGTVVAVWDTGDGRMKFIAPTPWHPYFRSISLPFVWANVNREISW